MSVTSNKMLTISNRVYIFFLLAYPARFRRDYGPHMAQLFRDKCRGTLQQGGITGIISLWFFTCIDLVKTAFAEHIMEVFLMPVEKLIRGSGPAAMLAGLLWIVLFVLLEWEFSNLVSIILFTVLLLLFAYGLAGIYHRLPKTLVTRLTFLAVAVALVWVEVGGAVTLFTEGGWTLFITGFYFLALCLVLVGVVTLAAGALSRWSFLPVLMGLFMVGFIVSGGDPTPPLQTSLGIAFGLSWIILGVVLWLLYQDTPNPALPA